MSMSQYTFYAWSIARDSFKDTTTNPCRDSIKGTRFKQVLYFPAEMHKDLVAEAERLGTSRSCMVFETWRRARTKMKMFNPSP